MQRHGEEGHISIGISIIPHQSDRESWASNHILPRISPQKNQPLKHMKSGWTITNPQRVSRRLLSIHVSVKTERFWTFIDAPVGENFGDVTSALDFCWLVHSEWTSIEVIQNDITIHNYEIVGQLFGQPEQIQHLVPFSKHTNSTHQIHQVIITTFLELISFYHLQWSCTHHSSTGRL